MDWHGFMSNTYSNLYPFNEYPSKLLLGRCAQFIEQSSQSFCFVDFSSLQFRAQSKHDCRNPILSRHFCIAQISRCYQVLTLCRGQRPCPLLTRNCSDQLNDFWNCGHRRFQNFFFRF